MLIKFKLCMPVFQGCAGDRISAINSGAKSKNALAMGLQTNNKSGFKMVSSEIL